MKKANLQKAGRENWVTDDDATHCSSCSAEFGLHLWKHHCRACGSIFCWRCSSKVIGFTPCTREHEWGYMEKRKRVCDACYTHIVVMRMRGADASRPDTANQEGLWGMLPARRSSTNGFPPLATIKELELSPEEEAARQEEIKASINLVFDEISRLKAKLLEDDGLTVEVDEVMRFYREYHLQSSTAEEKLQAADFYKWRCRSRKELASPPCQGEGNRCMPVLSFKPYYQATFCLEGTGVLERIHAKFPCAHTRGKSDVSPVLAAETVFPFRSYYQSNFCPYGSSSLELIYRKFPGAGKGPPVHAKPSLPKSRCQSSVTGTGPSVGPCVAAAVTSGAKLQPVHLPRASVVHDAVPKSAWPPRSNTSNVWESVKAIHETAKVGLRDSRLPSAVPPDERRAAGRKNEEAKKKPLNGPAHGLRKRQEQQDASKLQRWALSPARPPQVPPAPALVMTPDPKLEGSPSRPEKQQAQPSRYSIATPGASPVVSPTPTLWGTPEPLREAEVAACTYHQLSTNPSPGSSSSSPDRQQVMACTRHLFSPDSNSSSPASRPGRRQAEPGPELDRLQAGQRRAEGRGIAEVDRKPSEGAGGELASLLRRRLEIVEATSRMMTESPRAADAPREAAAEPAGGARGVPPESGRAASTMRSTEQDLEQIQAELRRKVQERRGEETRVPPSGAGGELAHVLMRRQKFEEKRSPRKKSTTVTA